MLRSSKLLTNLSEMIGRPVQITTLISQLTIYKCTIDCMTSGTFNQFLIQL